MESEFSRRPLSQPVRGRLASELRGFGPPGLFALFTIVLTGTITIQNIALPIGALLVLLWARISRTPLCEIGYVRPGNWFTTVLVGIVFGCTFKLLTKAVIMPLLGAGPVNLVYHYLTGNKALLPFAVWRMVVAGFAEETVFRGYLFERFDKLLGKKQWAKSLTILVTSLWFGLAHIQSQGYMGMVHATLLGLVFGMVYACTGRLVMLMIAHAAYDLTALALIYWNVEREVAQFFFH